MKKIIAIGLSLLIVFVVNAQSARSKVFDNLNTIIKKAEGAEQGKDVFGKDAIILKKQVFTETSFTLTSKDDGADWSWINRNTKIDWNLFYDHYIASGYPSENLCEIQIDFNKHRFTEEFYSSDKNGDDSPSKTGIFKFYCLLKDKAKVEKELQSLYKLVPVKPEPAINAQIRKYTKGETIAWLKEKLSKNIVGDNLTTKIKLISIDECKILYSYSSIVNRNYEETIPTSISSISKTKRFTYDQKICKIKYFAFGIINPEDETREYDLSFLRLNTTDDDLVSSIACAMKHLAGFCKAPTKPTPTKPTPTKPTPTTPTTPTKPTPTTVSESGKNNYRDDRSFFTYAYDAACKTGASFGRINNTSVGMYVTARFNADAFLSGGSNGTVDNSGVVTGGQFANWGNDWRFKNEVKTGTAEIMIGLTKKITYPLWIYAGAGASINTVFWRMDIYDNLGDYYETGWVKNTEASNLKPVYEGGLIVDLGGINIRGGVKTQNFKETIVTLGLGFSLKR
jgi:hypothetical protein